MSTTPSTAGDPYGGKLPRVLGLTDAVMLVVGSIIGSGIFLKPAVVAGELGAFGPILAVWVLMGLVTFCGALALAELAAMLPQAGGPYVYLREAYGKLPAFLWGWTEFWIIRTGSLGALSAATAIYLNEVVRLSGGRPLTLREQELIALAIVLVLSVVNLFSTRWGASVQNVTVVIKVAFLAGLIVLPFALGRADPANLEPWMPAGKWSWEGTPTAMKAFGAAMIAVLWPYDGWINVAPVSEEIREPERNVPRALATGMFIVITVYVTVNVAYHLVLPIDRIAASKAVASDVCTALLGNWGGILVAAGVMFSTFGAVNSNLIVGPRIYFAMARDGLLPGAIGRVHESRATPANAIIAQAAWSMALIMIVYEWTSRSEGSIRQATDAFDLLTNFVIFGGCIFYALAVGSVYVLRYKLPDLPRPYRTWGYPVTPAIFLLAFGAAIVQLYVGNQRESQFGTVLIIAGVVYFFIATAIQRQRTRIKGPAAD